MSMIKRIHLALCQSKINLKIVIAIKRSQDKGVEPNVQRVLKVSFDSIVIILFLKETQSCHLSKLTTSHRVKVEAQQSYILQP